MRVQIPALAAVDLGMAGLHPVSYTHLDVYKRQPIIGLIAGAMFGGSSLVAVSAYFIGMAAIICSGIMLKKTKLFARCV